MASSSATTTGAIYGLGVFGTDNYGSAAVTINVIPGGSEGVLELGFVEVSTVELGVDKVVNVNGVEGQLNIGTISVTANVFDFSAVANNFERRRTVHIHRLTTGLDRTVKVA